MEGHSQRRRRRSSAHEESRRPIKKELSEEQPSTGHVSRNAPTDLGQSPIRAATGTGGVRLIVPSSPEPAAATLRWWTEQEFHAEGHVRQSGMAERQIRMSENHAPIAVLLRPACAESAEPLHSTRTGASRRAPSHFGTRIKLRHPSQIGTWNRHIQRSTASAPWFGTILTLVSNHPRRVRLPPVWCKKNMGNDKKKPAWEKNSRGFWLAVCLVLSALAGWLMFHLNILR